VKTDAAIKEDIEDELFWSPFVDLDEVTVKVDGGTAILTGEVDSLGEYEAATENALEGGAHEVDNNLVVR
jgi:osmotically-inducible protein OsmY